MSPKPLSRYLRPKSQQLPRRKALTIAIALMAQNGVVVAADTQESTGNYMKGDANKMASFLGGGQPTRSEAGACVVAGAGDSGHVKLLIEQLGFSFMSNGEMDAFDPTGKSQENIAGIFHSCMKQFYAEHVIPLATLRDRPDVEMLMVMYRKFDAHIFYTEKTAIIPGRKYKAIGIGSTYAELLLGQLWKSGMTITEAEVLAAYVVFMAKECVESCGNYTTMLTLEGNVFFPGSQSQSDGVRYTDWRVIDSWERVFRMKWIPDQTNLVRENVRTIAEGYRPEDKRMSRDDVLKRMAIIHTNSAAKQEAKKKNPGGHRGQKP